MARYADAIFWLVANDDTEFLDDPNGSLSVTACLVSDLFSKDDKQVRSDLIRERTKQERPVKSIFENF